MHLLNKRNRGSLFKICMGNFVGVFYFWGVIDDHHIIFF